MTSGGLPIKAKSERLEFLDDLPVTKAGQPAQSSPHHNCEPGTVSHCGKLDRFFTFRARIQELACHAARDFQSLRYGSALRNQTRQLIGGCQVNALRKVLDLNVQKDFHDAILAYARWQFPISEPFTRRSLAFDRRPPACRRRIRRACAAVSVGARFIAPSPRAKPLRVLARAPQHPLRRHKSALG